MSATVVSGNMFPRFARPLHVIIFLAARVLNVLSF